MFQQINSERIRPLSGLPPANFETERLKLRLIEHNDAELIFNLYAKDLLATKYMSIKCTGNIDDTIDYVTNSTRYAEGKDSNVAVYTWLITIKESDEAIGTAGYGPKNENTLSGGYILSPKFWGKGYASEAWNCLVDWAKTQPGVGRIEAYHHPGNPASGKILEKSGMKCEGVFERHSTYPNLSDEPGDAVVYAWQR